MKKMDKWKIIAEALECAINDPFPWNACAVSDKSFGFIPLDIDKFVDALSYAKKLVHNYERNFVDAGCGTGSKLIIAKAMGFESYGIELSQLLHESANKYVPDFYLRRENINTHDFSKYNIIYFYRPFKEDKDQEKFESHVADTTKKGSVIISMCGTDFFNKDKRFKCNKLIHPHFKFNSGRTCGDAIYKKIA